MKLIQDTPLTNIADDKLGRENIVDLIVDSINNVSSNFASADFRKIKTYNFQKS